MILQGTDLITNLLQEAVANAPFFGVVLWMVVQNYKAMAKQDERWEKRVEKQDERWEQNIKFATSMEKMLTDMSFGQAKAQESLGKLSAILDKMLERIDRQDKARA